VGVESIHPSSKGSLSLLANTVVVVVQKTLS